MAQFLSPPLASKAGTLQVIIVVRHSGGPNQTDISLDAQERTAREYISANWGGPVEYILISSRVSGEWLNRDELQQLQDHISTRRFDVVIADEGSRIIRDVALYAICGLCKDNDTRLIAPNDNIDTAQDGWELLTLFAGFRGGQENSKTSERLKSRCDQRFIEKGMIGSTPRWLIKPMGVKTDQGCSWDADAIPVILELVSKLESSGNASAVADWLNSDGVDPWDVHPERERDVRRGNRPWDAGTVLQFARNPMLAGRRFRGKKRTEKRYSTGRRIAVTNPDPTDVKWREVPHLALITRERQDALIAKLSFQNANRRRKGSGCGDPRRNVPRKRTVWPGQAMTCSVCRRPYHYGANGTKLSLGCRGYQDYKCWNPALALGPVARRNLLTAVSTVLDGLQGWPEEIMRNLAVIADTQQQGRRDEIQRLESELCRVSSEVENYTKAIGQGVSLDLVREALQSADVRRRDLQANLGRLRAAPVISAELPRIDEIRVLAREVIATANSDGGLDDVIRVMVGKIVVYPVRQVGTDLIRGIGEFTLDLTTLVPSLREVKELEAVLKIPIKVDLFNRPQQAVFAAEVARLRGERLSYRAIAKRVGITMPAARNAYQMWLEIQNCGASDPYVPVDAAPDYGRYSRHHHERYRFERRVEPTT